jgi:acyl carrier protein
MHNEQLFAELNTLFRKVFPGLTAYVGPGTTARDIRGWDSLTHMLLIREVEKHYGISFSFQEARSFRTVGDLAAAITAHLTC